MADIRETRLILCLLRKNMYYTLKEQFERKVVIICQQELKSYSLNIRSTTNPKVKKYGIVMIPSMTQMTETHVEGTQHPTSRQARSRTMQIIIWNCRGAQSPNFCRNFKSLLNYHQPTLVALLEIHLQNYTHLRDDFGFNSMAQAPTDGQSGGIALLWHS